MNRSTSLRTRHRNLSLEVVPRKGAGQAQDRNSASSKGPDVVAYAKENG